MNENYEDCHHRKTTRSQIHKKGKHSETFLYTKSQKLFKKLDNFRYVFVYKKPYTLRYGIFMKFLKLAFLCKKHDTLRYVKFYIQKARQFAKSNTIWDTFLYTKIWHFCVAWFSLNFWNLRRGGGIYLLEKQCTLREIFILKNIALCVTLLNSKSLTLCVTF